MTYLNDQFRWYGTKVHQIGVVNLQKTMSKVFNYALREMKSGALCALVDASQQQVRNRSQDAVTAFANPPNKRFFKGPVAAKSALKTVDSLGNSSLDFMIDSPTVHTNLGIFSKFSFLIKSTTSENVEVTEPLTC